MQVLCLDKLPDFAQRELLDFYPVRRKTPPFRAGIYAGSEVSQESPSLLRLLRLPSTALRASRSVPVTAGRRSTNNRRRLIKNHSWFPGW